MGVIYNKLTEYGWNVAVRKRTDGLILSDRKTPFFLIPNTWRTWEADPFLFEHEGNVYVFAEMFDYFTRHGSIGYSRLEEGCWSGWKVVIDEPFHMSYPNVFRVGQEIFMIPETGADYSLRLYRAVSFPDKWELFKVLERDIRWVDTTLWSEQDKLYAITRDEAEWNNQRDILLELNDQFDVVSIKPIEEGNIALSRSAGKFIDLNGMRIRVSQDCSSHYGGALVFSQFNGIRSVGNGMESVLLLLKPEDLNFSETAEWTGLHTYNYSEHYEVVDVERHRFHIGGFFTRLVSKFRHH